jgi:hypothetical protein
MAAQPTFKHLWHSLPFSAQLAALTTLLILVTTPLATINSLKPTRTNSRAYSATQPITAACTVSGCSGELCVDTGQTGGSICLWKDEYACYQTARCERQPGGLCGWTQTPELTGCLARFIPTAGTTPTPLRNVVPTGLSTTSHRPYFVSHSLPIIYRNRPYTATITGRDKQITGRLTLTAQNLPAGLKIGSCQTSNYSAQQIIACTITGTTTVPADTYLVTFRLADSSGNTTTKTFPFRVTRFSLISYLPF